MNIDLKLGDIILVANNKKTGIRGFYAKAIKYFTETNWTHTAIGAGIIGTTPVFFEADTHVLIDSAALTFDDPGYNTAVYRHKYLTAEQQIQVMDKLFSKFNDKIYGYLKILYFLRRWFWTRKHVLRYMGWILDLIGKSRDTRNWNNWFVNGTICSEVAWWTIYFQEELYPNSELHSWLVQWNSNNYEPKDADQTLEKFSNLYELIYSK